MEKRSRRRTRDLVAQAASQGLSENEIGCARISMMARSKNAPVKGRIQKRKTLSLHCSFRLATHGRSIQSCHNPTSPIVAERGPEKGHTCPARSTPRGGQRGLGTKTFPLGPYEGRHTLA